MKCEDIFQWHLLIFSMRSRRGIIKLHITCFMIMTQVLVLGMFLWSWSQEYTNIVTFPSTYHLCWQHSILHLKSSAFWISIRLWPYILLCPIHGPLIYLAGFADILYRLKTLKLWKKGVIGALSKCWALAMPGLHFISILFLPLTIPWVSDVVLQPYL